MVGASGLRGNVARGSSAPPGEEGV